MKLIFLDIDGVLNVYPNGFDAYGRLFHPDFVTNLDRIIKETGAKLIISSSWRSRGIDNLKELWGYRNIAGEIVGVTPDLWDEVEGEEYPQRRVRGYEIQAVLDRYTDIESYVIIDDDTDMLPSQMKNFVNTSNNINHPDSVDIGIGLTNECANKAIRILNYK
jgi:hypothetical protein